MRHLLLSLRLWPPFSSSPLFCHCGGSRPDAGSCHGAVSPRQPRSSILSSSAPSLVLGEDQSGERSHA